LAASVAPAGNPNPGVLPINSKAFGKSYGDWGAAWWSWALGVPAATNPILDPDGSFGAIDQSGKVWFLAGTFGGSAERTVSVPKGKAIFFPLINSVWWAPEDLAFAAFVADTILGIDPDTLTDEELIRLLANFQVTFEELSMTCTIDGHPLEDLEQYRAESAAFEIEDTDLLDDLGVPISEDNLAVAAGYWIMLAPLTPGEHEIIFTVESENVLFGTFNLDVTYHITVE
jgi:hypothetical protein